MDKKIVYAVSKGDYSSYEIDKIFTTIEKAQEYINLVNNKHNFYSRVNDDIEEYELDPDITIKSPPKFKTFYRVEMYRDGNIKDCSEIGYDPFDPEDTEKERYRLYGEKHYNEETGRFEYYYILSGYNINADNEEHAIKRVADKRSFLLRIDRWPDKWDTQNMESYIEVM
jgi:hypothetical protein